MKDAIILFLLSTIIIFLMVYALVKYVDAIPVCERPLKYLSAQDLKECGVL